MNWRTLLNSNRLLELLKSDYLKLAPILALAFYVASIPHLGSPYRLHIDEWVHIAHSNSLLRAGDIFYPDPFSGQGSSGIIGLLELGYHVPLAVFRGLSGVSWIDIAGYFPSITFVITILSVYVFAKKLGFGWEAAFFASLLPTAVGIMGPGLLVPVAMGLMFVPLLLLLILNHRTGWSYAVICLLLSFLVILHTTSAILALIAVAPAILISMRKYFRHSLFVVLALALPFVITLPWTSGIIVSEARSLFVQKPLPEYHSLATLLQEYGYIPAIFSLSGIFVLTIRGGTKNYSLIFGLMVMAAMLAVYSTLHYGIDLLYLRGLLTTMLLMGILAGAGLMTLRKLDLPGMAGIKEKKPLYVQFTGALLSLVIIGVTLGVALPDRKAAPYYDMIDKTDYEAFAWIRDNVAPDYRKAVLDPWKATAFTAVTERYVYARIHMAPRANDEAVYKFLKNGSTNTEFLRNNGITLIYTRVHDYREGQTYEYAVNNPDLLEVNKNIWVLKDAQNR